MTKRLKKNLFFKCKSSLIIRFIFFNNFLVHFNVTKMASCPLEADANVVASGMEQHEKNKELCKLHGFRRPIPYAKFLKMDFRYVATFSQNTLQLGYRFFTIEELSKIKRKINKPFCHPGPEKLCGTYHWYLADSIVQKVMLKNDHFPHYVVRWVGYEDK